jgi:nucleoside-diphosphate-sugar epimerase
MRVVVLGGTIFIGRAMVEELHRRGHAVLVVHRGQHEPEDWVPAEHLHVAREELTTVAGELAAFRPDVVIDTMALTRASAEGAVAAVPAGVRTVVLSSMDVYQAYGDLHAGRATQPVPFDEGSPVRTERFPYRGQIPGMDDYEKLDVEEVYGARRATVCRLPAVFGPHDTQRREAPILDRLSAGRDRIPFGPGNWLWSRLHVHDCAVALAEAAEREEVAGEVLNIGPRQVLTIRQWAETILDAAGTSAELVAVPADALPADLAVSSPIGQHMVADCAKARSLLGWSDGDPWERVRQSVAWHVAHPSEAATTAFPADDEAIARA